MLDQARVEFDNVYYDYIFVVTLKNSTQTIYCADYGIFQGHVKIAKAMRQTYTAYTWNADHNCYVQSACYPRIPA